MVLMAVIVKLRLRLPPRSTVQMLEAPPAGEIPVKKKPNRIGTESRNSNSPIAYDNCEHANNVLSYSQQQQSLDEEQISGMQYIEFMMIPTAQLSPLQWSLALLYFSIVVLIFTPVNRKNLQLFRKHRTVRQQDTRHGGFSRQQRILLQCRLL